MGGFLGRRELHAFVSQSSQVHAIEQALTPSQQDRRDRDVHFINEARAQVLLHGVSPTANANVHALGCIARQI